MDTGHDEIIYTVTSSNEESVVMMNTIAEDIAEEKKSEKKYPEIEEIKDFITQSSDNFNTVKAIEHLTEETVVLDTVSSIGKLRQEAVKLEQPQYQDQVIRELLERVHSIEDANKVFREGQQEKFMKMSDQFSSLQEDLEKILVGIFIKLQNLEIDVANSQVVYENSNQDLKHKLEISEQTGFYQATGPGFQKSNQEVKVNSSQQLDDSIKSCDEEEKTIKERFETAHGFWKQKSGDNFSFQATAFPLDPKKPETTDDTKGEEDCVNKSSGDSNKNEDVEKINDEGKKSSENIFEKLRRKTVIKWQALTDEKCAKSEYQPEATEEEAIMTASSLGDNRLEKSQKETGIMGDEIGETKEESKAAKQKPDKSQDSDPKVNYLRIFFQKTKKSQK